MVSMLINGLRYQASSNSTSAGLTFPRTREHGGLGAAMLMAGPESRRLLRQSNRIARKIANRRAFDLIRWCDNQIVRNLLLKCEDGILDLCL